MNPKSEATKEVFFDILTKNKIKTFTVSFDGSGDSGQIESIDLDSKILKNKVKGIRFVEGTAWDPEKSESIEQVRDEATIEEVVEQICYDYLQQFCGGWEINEGSYGEFVFHVENRKISLDYNERVVEVQSRSYNF